MNYEQSICLPIYARSLRSDRWGAMVMMVAETIARKLGIDLDHVLCIHKLGKKAPLKSEYDYAWNQRTKEQLDALLQMENPEFLSFTATKPDQGYPCLWINVQVDVPYHLLYIEWREGKSASGGRISDHFPAFLELLSVTETLCDSLYALVTRMSIAALPAMYFAADADVPNMTSEQDENSLTWYEQRMDFWRKVRGVYWGNLLSAEHLSVLGGTERFMQRIVSIVGSDLVARLEEDKVFFMLPDMDESRTAVERLLVEADLLMRPLRAIDEGKR